MENDASLRGAKASPSILGKGSVSPAPSVQNGPGREEKLERR